MKRTSILGMVVTMLYCSTALADPIWTETFEMGVGRFDQTRGLGDIKFVWNGSTQQIDGEFERRTSGRRDRRYAEIGQTITHNDMFGFSVVLTPNAISLESHAAANIGFWNSNEVDMDTWVGVRIGRPTGILISGTDANGGPIGLGNNSPYVDFSFGQTYLINFLSNGTGDLSLDVYLGSDASGSLLGTTSWTLQPDEVFEVNSLGMGNPGNGSTTFWTSIDDFSYTVPEPSTAILLMAGSLMTLRRRRIK